MAHPDGRGQCAALADLLYQTLKVAGVDAKQRVIKPKQGQYDGFRVREGKVQGGQILQPWPFDKHVIVALDSQPNNVYDPSYGVITSKRDAASVEEQWEKDKVVDLRIGPNNWLGDNPPGQDLDWFYRTN